MIREGLLSAEVKKPGIGVHNLQHLRPTFVLLNHANPMGVQKTMRHQDYARTEIYMDEVKRLRMR